MADWPTLAQLQRVLDFDPEYGDPAADTLASILEAAIARVKLDVGAWDEYEDVPDDSLSYAALRMAELMALRPERAAGIGDDDPTYQRLLFGHRREFGIAS